MTRLEKFNVCMWATFLLAALAVFAALNCLACAAPTKQDVDTARAADCMAEIRYVIRSSPSCQVAVLRLSDLAKLNPSCAWVLGDGGLHLTCSGPVLDGGGL
jgi:hypothetical protein